MQVTKIKDGEYLVTGLPVNGHDWRLIREPGTGTYAVYDDGDDDKEVIVEEYSDSERRALWDKMTLFQVVSAAHKEISKIEASKRRRTSAPGM